MFNLKDKNNTHEYRKHAREGDLYACNLYENVCK